MSLKQILILLILVVLSFQQATVLKKENMCSACKILRQQPSLLQNLNQLRQKILERNPSENKMALRAVFMSMKLELEKTAKGPDNNDFQNLHKICEMRVYCGTKQTNQNKSNKQEETEL